MHRNSNVLLLAIALALSIALALGSLAFGIALALAFRSSLTLAFRSALALAFGSALALAFDEFFLDIPCQDVCVVGSMGHTPIGTVGVVPMTLWS